MLINGGGAFISISNDSGGKAQPIVLGREMG